MPALRAIRARARDDKDKELHRLEQQEIQRLELLRQDHLAQDARLEDSDNSPWLRWT